MTDSGTDRINNVIKYLEKDYGATQWIQVCGHADIYGADAGFWCGFISNDQVEQSLADYSWDISIQSGFPGFETTGRETVYISSVHDGKEPLLFYRDFYGIAQDYVEISQEFILLNNLRFDKKSKRYFAMNESGVQEEAVQYIDDCTIRIKTKFLKKYASAKQLALVLQYDIRTQYSGSLSDHGFSDINEVVKRDNLCYSISEGVLHAPNTMDVRILGKKVIAPAPVEECGFWPYEKETDYEEFIIGSDEKGNPISYSCNPEGLGNYFGANPTAPMYLTPVFFSREVLQKYYAKPELYSITDGYLSCQSLWGIAIDNHHKDIVAAYLGDLGRDLPEAEQKHWKQFNILTDESLSVTSRSRDFFCIAADSNIVEHQFKNDYRNLVKQWNEKYGWSLYNPLSDEDAYIFDQIRRPLGDSQAEFDQLVLLLCKLMIDYLNEKELSKSIDDSSHLKGIGKLEQWVKNHNVAGFEAHIAFLRNLWELRSSGSGHAKGKAYKTVAKKFGIEELPLPEVFDNILGNADSFLQFMLNAFI